MSNLLRLNACQLIACATTLLCVEAAWANDKDLDAQALGKGDWLLHGSVISIRSLTQSSDIPAIGGRVKSQDMRTLGLDISYFVSDHWAFEFQGGRIERDYSVANSTFGSFSVGRIDTYAVTLALQYHFKPSELMMPYVGLGINYSWAGNVEPAENIPDFDVKPIASALMAVGVDVPFAPHWVANASARYILSPTYNFDGDGFQASVRINTLILGAGIGFYF